MVYIQRNEIILTEYGWSQAFWIYLMIGIYVMSSITGGIEFFRIKHPSMERMDAARPPGRNPGHPSLMRKRGAHHQPV